jgi:thioredoxin 1
MAQNLSFPCAELREKFMANVHVKTATDQNFPSDILKAERVTLVDFWAEWCGPCRMLGPTIDAIAEEFAGRVNVFKHNVDDNPMTPGQYSIRGIPTLLVFKNGQVVDQIVGNQPKEVIVQALQRHL